MSEGWPHLSFPQMVTPLSQHHWLNHPITPSRLITQFNKHKPLYSIYTSALSAWNPACLPYCFNYSSSIACLLSLGVTSLPPPITLFGICSLFLGCLFFHMNFQLHLSPSKVTFTVFSWLWSLCGFIEETHLCGCWVFLSVWEPPQAPLCPSGISCVHQSCKCIPKAFTLCCHGHANRTLPTL